jgi:predicted enzyme related to lactoylglutathione lyase
MRRIPAATEYSSVMRTRLAEFRYFYFTDRYEETVAFYRDRLGWETMRSWDHGPLARGTVFHAPNRIGLIEIEAGTERPTSLGGLYIEVEDVDTEHAKLVAAAVPLTRGLADTSYGHRAFRFVDPSGLTISIFSYL